MDKEDYNTSMFQVYPDFVKEIPEEPYLKKNSNSRYKFFKQNYFTAGDFDQFLEYWDPSPCYNSMENHPIDYMYDHPHLHLDLYKGLCLHDMIHTYHYIADKFKKGLFLKILNKKIKVYLPFSKVNYQNEWFNKIIIDKTHYQNMEKLIRYTANQEHREFHISKFNYDIKTWYGNNGLVRCEFPISEGDSGLNMLKDMMESVVRERNVPNIEFFVNKRDFPILKKNRTEAYDNFFGRNHPLLSHSYTKYAPILSMNTGQEYADIPIPTWYDWSIVAYQEDKKMFSKEYCTFPSKEDFQAIPWKDKKPTAIFRGASTGLGTTLQNNIRLYYCHKSLDKKRDVDGQLFLDAGITKWNVRPRISLSHPYLETIRLKDLDLPLVPFVPPIEQARYKYILHLPGHTCAYRLSLELLFGSVILLYPCDYELWYFRFLKPWKHYIPIDPLKKDDLFDKIRWCKRNDDRCQEIAKEAQKFASVWINRNTILDYLHNLLWKICIHSFPSPYMNPRSYQEIQRECAISLLQKYDRHMTSSLLRHPEVLNFYQEEFKKKNVVSRFSSPSSPWSHATMETFFYYLDQQQELETFLSSILMKQENLYYKSRHTEIYSFSLGGRDLLLKKTVPNWQKDEWNHVLLSKFILNPLRSTCPYLMYFYYFTETTQESISILERKEGNTFEKSIMNEEFSFADLVNLWIALIFIILECREVMNFDHMDLYPWNIMVYKSNLPQSFHNSKHDISFTSSWHCSIIDYEKSFFIHEGLAYYNISPFSFGQFYNILTMIFSSLFLYLSTHYVDSNTTSLIILIMNYILGILQLPPFFSLMEIKCFLKFQKKFSTIMTHHFLPNKSVLEFLYYMDSLQIPGVSRILYFPPPKNMSVHRFSSFYNPILVSYSFDTYMKYFEICLSRDIPLLVSLESIPETCIAKNSESYENILHHYLHHLLSKTNHVTLSSLQDMVDIALPSLENELERIPYPSTCSHICSLCTEFYSKKDPICIDQSILLAKQQKCSIYLDRNKNYSFFTMWTTFFRPLSFLSILHHSKLIK